MTVEQEVKDLLQDAKTLPYGFTQLAMLEQAQRLASAHQLGRLQYDVHNDLISAVVFVGQGHRAVSLFSWSLNYFDEHEDEMTWRDRWSLMWRYKWITSRLPDFHQVPLQSIFDSIEDMRRRYVLYGYKDSPIHKRLMWIYLDIGENEKARESYEKWVMAERSLQSDCEACDVNSKVSYFIHMGEFKVAYETAQPLLHGEMGCECVPHSTFGKILPMAIQYEGREVADRYHQRGYEMIRTNIGNYYSSLRYHMLYLCMTEQDEQLLRLLDEHIEGMITQVNPLSVLFVYRALHRIFDTLSTRHATLTLRTHETWPIHQKDGTYTTADLASWFDTEGRELADLFDARNNNQFYANWFDQHDHKYTYAPQS